MICEAAFIAVMVAVVSVRIVDALIAEAVTAIVRNKRARETILLITGDIEPPEPDHIGDAIRHTADRGDA